MPTGTLLWPTSQRVQIQPDGGAAGKTVQVERRVLEAGYSPGHAPAYGDRVEYTLQQGRDDRASAVRFIARAEQPGGSNAGIGAKGGRTEASQASASVPGAARVERRPSDRFLNPYNFVRPLPPARAPAANDVEAYLLGRCPPPPLDRYAGLTGWLECRITTHGRVFVSDSREVHGRVGDHRTYRFLRVPHPNGGSGDVPCIPASTLRGVVRSVFEAATNSCWEFVEDQGLSRRVPNGNVSTRTWFRNGIHDRFPADIDAVKPCTGVNAGATGALRLCPACRVFGWVAREQPGGAAPGEARADVARAVAVRSRVRFADAWFFDRETGVAAPLITHPATLQILGAPRPATVRFYLTLKNGRVVSGRSAEPGYDDPELVVRGRKFYRRHARSARFVRKRSKQNRTLRDHMASGQSAPFEVRFDNLAPLELGALLWSLELEPDWRHRLGLAKPLGFGDVSIRVEALSVFAGDRWSADPDEGATSLDVQALKSAFRSTMCRAYGESGEAGGFSELPNVRDLRAMLAAPGPLGVTYPLLPHQRLPEAEELPASPESYLWFNNNVRHGGRGHWLDLADGDRGLPFDPARG